MHISTYLPIYIMVYHPTKFVTVFDILIIKVYDLLITEILEIFKGSIIFQTFKRNKNSYITLYLRQNGNIIL